MTLTTQIQRFELNETNFNEVVTGSYSGSVNLGGTAGTVKTVAAAINTIIAGNDRGAWATATAYLINDIVLQAGAYYRVRENHTSGVFATDLASGKMRLNQGGDSSILTHRGRTLDDVITANFDTVAAFVADANVEIGDIVMTRAYVGTIKQYWQVVSAVTGTVDGGEYIALTGSSLRARQIFEDTVTPYHFGATMDGVNDDTVAFTAMMNFAVDEYITIDGLERPMLLKDAMSFAPTLNVKMRNFNIIAGTTYANQPKITFSTNVEYDLYNIKVDGERDTRVEVEPWQVFTTFNGVQSILPSSGKFIFISVFLTKDFYMDKLEFTNCHYDVCIETNSYANVNIGTVKFINCSNKTIQSWHAGTVGTDPDTGMTTVTHYTGNDCGILPANFLVAGVPSVRADNYSPQGSFGLIVTFGRFTLLSAYINNYGSTGITADRNRVFTGGHIHIKHTDVNAFSNNPSGGMWLEDCDKSIVDVLEVFVSNRDARETVFDNSLFQIYVTSGSICEVSNIILESAVGANINKDLRISCTAGATVIIDGYSLESNGAVASIGAANISGLSNKISLSNGRVRGADMSLMDSLDLTVKMLDSDVNVLVGPTLGVPVGDISMLDVQCAVCDLTGSDQDVIVRGGKMTVCNVTTTASSSFDKLIWDGGLEIAGVSTINGGTSVQFGQVETSGRTIFVNVQRVSITGGIYKTAIAEPILDFIPAPATMLQASVIGACLWIQTGAVGATYINFNGNVVNSTDTGNDKQTFAWT